VSEQNEKNVLNDHRQAERHEQRRQIITEREIQKPALQHVAESCNHRHDHNQRRERTDVQRLHGEICEISGDDDQIAMSNVDKAHDAEDQRQTGGEKRIEAAQQHALNNDVDDFHGGYTPK
jgi:hypothetical protein